MLAVFNGITTANGEIGLDCGVRIYIPTRLLACVSALVVCVLQWSGSYNVSMSIWFILYYVVLNAIETQAENLALIDSYQLLFDR